MALSLVIMAACIDRMSRLSTFESISSPPEDTLQLELIRSWPILIDWLRSESIRYVVTTTPRN